jgi:hypothetical protein
VNREQARAIRDLLRGDTRDIRVLCPPRGHFIADVGLYVWDGWTGKDPDDDPIIMVPRGPAKKYFGDLGVGHHGFDIAPDGRLIMRCQHRGCGYVGRFNWLALAAELAAAALAGRREYRLTA